MAKIMAATVRGLSFSMWVPDFTFGLVERWLLEKGVLAQYGHAHYELGGSKLQLIEEGIVDDDLLNWLSGEELRSLVERHDAHQPGSSP